MREAALRRMALLFAHGYRWVFSGSALVVVAILVMFSLNPPKIHTNIMDLLPQHSKVVQNFKSVTTDFKSLDYLFVVLHTKAPKKYPMADFEDFADTMADGLRKSGMVESVEYRLQDYEKTAKEMLPYTLLYLSPQDLSSVAKRFTNEAIRKQVEKNKLILANPASLITKQIIQYDPFGLFPILKKHFMGKTGRLNVDLSDGYYLSRDDESLIMIVRPTKPAQDIPFGRKLIATARRLEGKARRLWEKDNEESSSALTVSFGGGYPIAQDDANLIKRDAIVNTVTSVILVMFVFWWAFRKRSAIVYGWLPLLMGLLLAFAAAHLLGVTLNSVTAGFGALLVGLGIDFSIVIYGRFIEERNGGRGVEESIANVMGNTGKGVMVGAATTACTFGALLLTHFEGIREIGIFTGLGILFCALSVFTLMPAMLYYHHLHKTRKGINPTFQMHGFGFRGLARTAHRYPWWTLLIAGVATIALGVAAMGLKLEDNIQNLRSPDNRGVKVTKQVAKTFGTSDTYMMVAVDAPGPEGVLEESHRIVEALEPLIRRKQVLYTNSLSAYLPPRKAQEAVLASLKPEEATVFSYKRIRASFVSDCKSNGFNPNYFSSYLNTLKRMLNPSGPLTYKELSRGSLAPMLDRFIVKKGRNHFRGVVYLHVGGKYKRKAPDNLVSVIHKAVPSAKVVGINILSRSLRGQIKKDALLTFVVGNLLVFLLILLDFRNLRLTIYALLPLAVGLVWMLGTLRLMGESLNMMNIFVATLILGIGSDYGIHFVHRYLEEDGHDMIRVIQEIGVPIVIAGLTTIAGFGSMSLSSYPGLRSMGYVSLLGTLYCMVATLTVLVAVLTVAKRHPKRWKASGKEPRLNCDVKR